jgi:hypothetical protein
MPAVNWGRRPSKKAEEQNGSAVAKSALDKFVNPEASKSTKRLNAEIPADLHARMKAQCALAGRDMTEALIEILEARFPPK